MSQPASTKENLLQAARNLFWTRGYSNVSVRDITTAVGVDAALVSRYFGGKRGLFEATLAQIDRWSALDSDADDLLTNAVNSFAQPYDPKKDRANAFSMLIVNINDPEVGDDVRALVQQGLADPLAHKLDGSLRQERAAMLLAVLFGAALMRKNFQLQGMADKSPDDIAIQIRHLAQAALRFDG